MLIDGLKLVIIGLSTVFIFLLFMIYVINITSKVIAFFTPKKEEPKPVQQPKPCKPAVVHNTVPRTNKHVVAAITVAVNQYRSSRVR